MDELPVVCRRQPIAGEALGGRCPDCSHATAVHIGAEECPVCSLIARTKVFDQLMRKLAEA